MMMATHLAAAASKNGPHPDRSTNSTRKLHPSRPNQACLRKRIQSVHACSSTDLHCRRDTQNLHSSSRNRHFVSTLLAGHGLQAKGGHTHTSGACSLAQASTAVDIGNICPRLGHTSLQANTEKHCQFFVVANFFTHRRRRARE